MSGGYDLLLAVINRQDVGDLEVGCTVWHKTRQAAVGFVGGVVIDLLDDKVAVCRFHHGSPIIDVFDHVDINLEHTRFNGAEARALASGIHTWLGHPRNKKMDRAHRVGWGDIALALDRAGLVGLYLPRANARYLAALEARRAEREAS